MIASNEYKPVWKFFFTIPLITFCFALLYSCKNNNNQNQYLSSANGKHMLDSATNLLARTHQFTAVFKYLDGYDEQPGITVADRFNYRYFKSGMYLANKQYHMAITLADDAINEVKPYQSDKRFGILSASGYFKKAEIMFAQRRYNEAFKTYYIAKSAVRDSSDICTYRSFLSKYNHNLAEIWYLQAHYHEAINAYKQSIHVMDKCEQNFEVFAYKQANLDNIGICYTKLNQPDSALFYYDNALKYLKENYHKYGSNTILDEEAAGIIYGNRGAAEVLKGRYQIAEDNFKYSIQLNLVKKRNPIDARMTQIKLADLYLDINKPQQALPILQELATALPLLNNHEITQRYLLVKARYDEAVGHPLAALADHKAYEAELKINTDTFKELIHSDLTREFNLLEQNYQLQLAGKKNELYYFLLVGSGIFATFCLIVVYWVNKAKKAIKKQNLQINRQHKQLEITFAEIEESNRDYSRLMSILAHDMKNPLGAISGLSSLLIDEPLMSDDSVEQLTLIKSASEQLLSMISDLLETNTGNNEHREQVNLPELLAQSVELLKAKASHKLQQIILDASELVCLIINKNRVWRVINNILINAIKFSPENSSIRVTAYLQHNDVVISIADQGIGIPDHLHKELFKPLSQAKRSGTRGETSYGLGLYISKQIMEAHGGKLYFESKAAKGTTFYISFPKTLMAPHNC